MNKFLLSTSAIVGVSMIAAPAGAAERIKLSLGGFMQQWVGYASVEEDAARDFVNVDQQSNSEIFFFGSTTLDNGIRIGARIEMEGERANASTLDESWIHISSDSLGLLSLGEDDAAANATRYGMPDVGIGDGDAGNWVPGLGVVRFSPNIGRDDDEHKITYFTPASIQEMSGLQAVFSFIPEMGSYNDSLPNATADNQNAYGFAVTFQSGAMGLDLGGFDVSLQYGMLHESDGLRSAGSAGGGGHQSSGQIRFENFTVSGAYTRRQYDNDSRGMATNSDEGHSWEAGVRYAQGPYRVSVGYSSYSTEGIDSIQGDNEGNVWMVSGAWALSDGVDVRASFFEVDYDDEGSPVDANETSGGWGVVAGIVLNF